MATGAPNTTFTNRQTQTLSDLVAPALDPITSSASGQLSKRCTDQKGKIGGIGPYCRNERYAEKAAKETMDCRWQIMADCSSSYYDDVGDGLSRYQDGEKSADWRLNFSGPANIATKFSQSESSANAKQTHSDCFKEWQNRCECQRCWFTYAFPDGTDSTQTGPDTDDTSGDDTPVTTGPKYRSNRLTTNSNTGPIQQVLGRFVVGGNIIWIGNLQTVTGTYSVQGEDGNMVTINDIITTADILIGVSVGEVNELLRIWANDILIYNGVIDATDSGIAVLSGTNDGANGLTLSAMADSDYQTQRLSFITPSISLYTGSEAQQPLAEIIASAGAELAPGHRGLACVMLRGLDLALFGSTFPAFRFELHSKPRLEDVAPHVTSTADSAVFTNIDPAFLDVDIRTGLVFVKGTGAGNSGVRLFDYNSLEELYNANSQAANMSKILRLPSGNVLTELSNTTKVIVSPTKDMTRATVAVGSLGTGSKAASGVTQVYDWGNSSDSDYITDPLHVEYAFVCQSTGNFDIVRYDYKDDVASVLHSITATASKTLHATCFLQSSAILMFCEFLLPASGDQTNLTIDKYAVRNADGVVDQVTPPTKTTLTVLGSTAWGAALTGVSIREVIIDQDDQNFVVFIDQSGGSTKVVKMSAQTGTVAYTMTLPKAMPTYISNGNNLSIAPTPFYYYIADDGSIVRVTLATGASTIVNTLTDFSLPAIVGAQFFDAVTQSITYITDESPRRIVRLFPEKLVVDQMSLSEIIDAVIARTPLRTEFFDTSDLVDIEVDGMLVDGAFKVGTEIQTLCELFSVATTDTGQKILFKRQSQLNTATTLSAEDDFVYTSQNSELRIPANLSEAAEVSFYNIDFKGLQSMIQNVNLNLDINHPSQPLNISTALNVNAALIRNYLEQYLQAKQLEQYTLGGILLPKHLAISPTDRITVDSISYRIGGMDIGPDQLLSIRAFRHNQDNATSVALTAVPLYTDSITVIRNPFAPVIRPIVLFHMAFNDTDAGASVSNNQVAYSAIDAPGRQASSPIAFIVRIEDGSDYTTQEHEEGAHIGTLVTAPIVPPYHELFRLDRTSSMVIKFDHTDTKDSFQAGKTLDELKADPTINLLIVGDEYIQFQNFAVAGDDRTVTFTNLYRGVLGTDFYTRVPRDYDDDGLYIRGHAAGTRCYLYTPTTFLPFNVDPQETKLQPKVTLIFDNTQPYVGANYVDYGKRADAGASRPKPVSGIKRTRIFGISGGGYTAPAGGYDPSHHFKGNIAGWTYSWKRRRPIYMTSDQSNSSTPPTDYPDSYKLVGRTFELSLPEIELNYVREQDEDDTDTGLTAVTEPSYTTSSDTTNASQNPHFGDNLAAAVYVYEMNGSILGQPSYNHHLAYKVLPDPDADVS